MFTGLYGAGDLMVVGGFAEVSVVEVPVDCSIGTGMGGFEDELLLFAGKSFW